MTDLFDEVEEQLRSERYRVIARRVAPWILAALAVAFVVSLGIWGWQRYQTETASQASEQYTAGLTALGQGDTVKAASLFTDVSKSPSKAYKSLALMQLAASKMAAGKPAEVQAAVALLDQAAAAAPDDILGDAARLKSAFALLDTAPYKDVEARLTPLTKDGRPYRAQAREALAFAKLMAGNTAGARDDFAIIETSLDAPDSARQRARAAKDLIDSGSAKAVPAAVRAAVIAPPATPGLPPGLQLQQPPQGPPAQ